MRKFFVVFVIFAVLFLAVSCGENKSEKSTDTVAGEDTADSVSDSDVTDDKTDTVLTSDEDDKTDTGSKNDDDSGDTTPDNGDSSDTADDSGDSVADDGSDSQSDTEPDDDKVYSDCTISSTEPCYTVCSEEKDEYLVWLNGTLVNKKCKENSCLVSGKKIGVEPETCEQYTTPPESCNPETSAMLCSPDGQSVWNCDSITHAYYDEPCGAEAHCVQCQNRASCTPLENCIEDSAKNCNSVCNTEGDGYYMWDVNTEVLIFHACPQNDCIHLCGTAECKSGTGYSAGDFCEGSFGYCTKNGAFAFTCKDGHVEQKICKNNDCVYNAESNEITSCTAEQQIPVST